MLPHAIDAKMRPSTLDAAVTVLNEGSLEHLMRMVEIEMVDDTVAEMGCEHLTTLGIGDDEAI